VKRSLAFLLAIVLLAAAGTFLMMSDRRPGARSRVEVDARSRSALERPVVTGAPVLAAKRAVAEETVAQAEEEGASAELAQEPEVAEGAGVLWIQVESRETGEPLVGRRLRALVEPVEEKQAIIHADFSRGTELDSLVTDELGKAVYHLPAGREIRLEWWEDGFPRSVGSLELAPLAPAEDRDVDVRVSTEPDLTFVGRVVSAATGAPLVAARVLLRQGGHTLATVGAREDGLFQFVTDSWRRPYLRVSCAGYTPAVVAVPDGHETIAEALEIALRPGAALRVFVHDSSLLPLEEVTVVALAEADDFAGDELELGGLEHFSWGAETDEEGRVLLDNLPSRVPLELTVLGDPFGSQQEPERLVLVPGETKDVVIQILAPGKLRGRLVDRGRRPVSGKEVWLLPSASGKRYFSCGDQEASRWTSTGPDGRFVFEGVYKGTYLVGPCPPCPPNPRAREKLPRTYNTQQVAPLGFPVRAESAEVTEVELVVDRELYFTVRVVDESGNPVDPGMGVVAHSPPGQVGVRRIPDTNVLVAGPLQKGTYDVTAYAGRRRSKQKLVKSGADVEIVVRPVRPARGRISGRVISPVEGPLYATVRGVRLATGPADAMATVGGRRVDRVTGEFVLDHLETGTYLLEASAQGLTATQRVTLDSRDGEVSDVILRLDVGGSLVVETGQILADDDDRRRHQFWSCTVHQGDESVVETWFQGPRSSELEVPAGELTVELKPWGSEEGQTRVIELRPRQKKVVTFALD